MLELENGFTIAIRPSGTEPKIKYYLFGCGEKNALDLEKSKDEVSSKIIEISEWLVSDANERTK
jgi:phosphoglucomutase